MWWYSTYGNTTESEVQEIVKRTMFTGTYLLQKAGEKKHFGFVQGYSYLPEYTTEIKVYVNNDKFEEFSDVDDTKVLILDSMELESIDKAIHFVENSLATLKSLSKRNLLKDEFYGDEIL